MNKYETIGLFTAMEELQKNKLYDSVSKVIAETLKAAKGKPDLPEAKTDDTE